MAGKTAKETKVESTLDDVRAALRTSGNLEQQGAWMPVVGTFELRVRSQQSDAVRKWVRREMEKKRPMFRGRKKGADSMSLKEQDDFNRRQCIEVLITGWRGLAGEGFSKEGLTELINDPEMKHLVGAAVGFSHELSNFQEEEAAEILGNSERSDVPNTDSDAAGQGADQPEPQRLSAP